MKTALRNTAITLAASLALAACSNDSRSTEDVLAEDSTLALEVMAANTDTMQMPVDTAPSVEALAPENVLSTEPAPAPVIATEPATPPARETMRRSLPRRTRVARVARGTSTARFARPVRSTPMRSSATIPSGTDFSLTADQRICASMSNPGDRFTARFSEDLTGPLGVVIPKGTAVTAQIFSLEKGVDLRMHSIDFAGHTYTIDSDVTHTEIEKVTRKQPAKVDYCIPEGGKIAVRLTEPLKLTLSE